MKITSSEAVYYVSLSMPLLLRIAYGAMWNVVIFLTGIFEKHKLLYSFQMTMKLEQSHGLVTQEELDFFIKGSITLVKSERVSPAKWITAHVS
jgi:hypothetical protein